MKSPIVLLLLFLSLALTLSAKRPNVIIILSDDQGWGDVGFNGGTDIPTPNLDRLAADGTIFRDGYATHPYCSPSRAGLMTGRYQHRFGHENNPVHGLEDPNAGLPLSETTLARVLSDNGYATAAIGKWHLGDHEKFWPNRRGFDYWYGMYGGGLNYWGETGNKPRNAGVLRNGEIVPFEEISYLTDNFTDEAIGFIDRSKDKPFFIYLAYNAPHAPNQAPRKYLDLTAHIEDGERAVYAAMVAGMDVGIGRVMEKLRDEGLYDNTLIFFYSDNGAQSRGGSSAPFRGQKGMLFEGGIRVPFTATWPARLPANQVVSEPMIALDLFPTILAAAQIDAPKNLSLDGVNLLPRLAGHESSLPSRELYWRSSDGAAYAVRKGKYKLVKSLFKEESFLFDLQADPYEHRNLASAFPEKFDELLDYHKRWNAQMIPAKWQDPHLENSSRTVDARKKAIDAAMRGEKR